MPLRFALHSNQATGNAPGHVIQPLRGETHGKRGSIHGSHIGAAATDGSPHQPVDNDVPRIRRVGRLVFRSGQSAHRDGIVRLHRPHLRYDGSRHHRRSVDNRTDSRPIFQQRKADGSLALDRCRPSVLAGQHPAADRWRSRAGGRDGFEVLLDCLGLCHSLFAYAGPLQLHRLYARPRRRCAISPASVCWAPSVGSLPA